MIGLALFAFLAAAAPASRDAVLLNYGDVFRTDDYPVEALRKSESGTVGIRIAVSAAGLPTGCEVTVPSASLSLNAATCRLALERARFEPLRDKRGIAVAGHDMVRVRWVVPDLGTEPTTDAYFKVTFPITDKQGLGECRFSSPVHAQAAICDGVRKELLVEFSSDKFLSDKAGRNLTLYRGQFVGENGAALIGAMVEPAPLQSGTVATLTIDAQGRPLTCVARDYPSSLPSKAKTCPKLMTARFLPALDTESQATRTLTSFLILTIDGPEPTDGADEGSLPVKDAGLGGLFTADDYPATALRDNREGTVAVWLDVTTEGRIGACRVDQSSGVAELDEATCAILRRRARFTPALDQYGKPIGDRYRQRVRWALPRTAYKASSQRATISFGRNGKATGCKLSEIDSGDVATDCDRLIGMALILWHQGGRKSIAGRTLRIDHRTDIDMTIPLLSGGASARWRQVAQYRVQPDGRLTECRILANPLARDPLKLCESPVAGPYDVDPDGLFRSVRTTVALSVVE